MVESSSNDTACTLEVPFKTLETMFSKTDTSCCLSWEVRLDMVAFQNRMLVKKLASKKSGISDCDGCIEGEDVCKDLVGESYGALVGSMERTRLGVELGNRDG